MRAKRVVFDRPYRPFSLIFYSRIAKPHTRFQNIYFLAPYDFFQARVDYESGHFRDFGGGAGGRGLGPEGA
jgi:hypothetical protein